MIGTQRKQQAGAFSALGARAEAWSGHAHEQHSPSGTHGTAQDLGRGRRSESAEPHQQPKIRLSSRLGEHTCAAPCSTTSTTHLMPSSVSAEQLQGLQLDTAAACQTVAQRKPQDCLLQQRQGAAAGLLLITCHCTILGRSLTPKLLRCRGVGGSPPSRLQAKLRRQLPAA